MPYSPASAAFLFGRPSFLELRPAGWARINFEYACGGLGRKALHLQTATAFRYEDGEKSRLDPIALRTCHERK